MRIISCIVHDCQENRCFMTETYKFNNEEKELARRITDLQGQINRLDVIFEHNRKLNNHIVSALQTGDISHALKTAGALV